MGSDDLNCGCGDHMDDVLSWCYNDCDVVAAYADTRRHASVLASNGPFAPLHLHSAVAGGSGTANAMHSHVPRVGTPGGGCA